MKCLQCGQEIEVATVTGLYDVRCYCRDSLPLVTPEDAQQLSDEGIEDLEEFIRIRYPVAPYELYLRAMELHPAVDIMTEEQFTKVWQKSSKPVKSLSQKLWDVRVDDLLFSTIYGYVKVEDVIDPPSSRGKVYKTIVLDIGVKYLSNGYEVIDGDCPECSANHELPTLFLSADDAMEFIKEYI